MISLKKNEPTILSNKKPDGYKTTSEFIIQLHSTINNRSSISGDRFCSLLSEAASRLSELETKCEMYERIISGNNYGIQSS
jgi:hypothetical protein